MLIATVEAVLSRHIIIGHYGRMLHVVRVQYTVKGSRGEHDLIYASVGKANNVAKGFRFTM